MIRINQTGLKNFVFYVSCFVLLTLFIYLGIPFFFDYKNKQSDLERKIFENFDKNFSNIKIKKFCNIFLKYLLIIFKNHQNNLQQVCFIPPLPLFGLIFID